MRNINTKQMVFFALTLLLFCGGVFLCPGNVFAQGSLVAANLVEVAKEFYETGYYEKAIHEFSKALLIEPRNEEALEYLKKMGLDGGIYGYQKTALDHVYELNEEILNYQAQLQSLNDQNQAQQQHNVQLQEQEARLQELIQQKEDEKQKVLEQSEELKAVATMKIAEQQQELLRLQENDGQKKEELVRLNTDLFETKQKMVDDKKAIQNTAAEVEVLKRQMDEDKNKNEQGLHEVRVKYEDVLAQADKERNDLKQEVFTAEDEARQKKQKFQQALVAKDNELQHEKSKLIITSYQLAQQQAHVEDLKSRLSFLRGEKDVLAKEADLLRQQIDKFQQAQTFPYAKARPSSKEKKALIEHVRKQDDAIIDLKSRLVISLDKMKTLKETGSDQDAERIAELEQTVGDLEREIAQKEKDLESVEEQQDVLKDRISDYQERLEIVQGMIKDKEERILFLEEQLGADVYPDEK